uniref:Uncharacterized protein n=1 Tax=Arundo donax TaxID=35708 RepID=A0A0A9FWM0_ARUDO
MYLSLVDTHSLAQWTATVTFKERITFPK